MSGRDRPKGRESGPGLDRWGRGLLEQSLAPSPENVVKECADGPLHEGREDSLHKPWLVLFGWWPTFQAKSSLSFRRTAELAPSGVTEVRSTPETDRAREDAPPTFGSEGRADDHAREAAGERVADRVVKGCSLSAALRP